MVFSSKLNSKEVSYHPVFHNRWALAMALGSDRPNPRRGTDQWQVETLYFCLLPIVALGCQRLHISQWIGAADHGHSILFSEEWAASLNYVRRRNILDHSSEFHMSPGPSSIESLDVNEMNEWMNDDMKWRKLFCLEHIPCSSSSPQHHFLQQIPACTHTTLDNKYPLLISSLVTNQQQTRCC